MALALAAAILQLTLACAPAAPHMRAELVLGTLCKLSLYGRDRPETAAAVFERLRIIEARMSANLDDSEVSRVSRSAGIAPQTVSEDTFYVIKTAKEFAELTDGAFDPTIAPLVRLWGIGTENARLPSEEEIEAARRLVDYRGLILDPAARSVFLERAGMGLDLGAIAKGYAADEAASILRAAGVESAIIDLGGNVYTLGRKRGGKPFRIGIQDPAAERGSYLGALTITDRSLVTSGPYERFFIEGGRRYHHILDRRTGYPSDSGLVSVTIIGASSIRADALSTSVFVMGKERGLALLAGQAGVSAILVDESGAISLSGPESSSFELLDMKKYHLE